MNETNVNPMSDNLGQVNVVWVCETGFVENGLNGSNFHLSLKRTFRQIE